MTLLISDSKKDLLVNKFSGYTENEIIQLFENEKVSNEKLYTMKELNFNQIKLYIFLKTVSIKRNIICSFLLELFKQNHFALMI